LRNAGVRAAPATMVLPRARFGTTADEFGE
jgi:hypothetical protein